MTDKLEKPEVEVKNLRYKGATPEMVARALLRPFKKRRKHTSNSKSKDGPLFQLKG